MNGDTLQMITMISC